MFYSVTNKYTPYKEITTTEIVFVFLNHWKHYLSM